MRRVDYARIIALAEREFDLILWDGGNNDFPFVRPDLHVVLVDPLRPGHETGFHPGETALRMADVVVVSKTDAAHPADVERVIANVRRANPRASVVRAALSILLDDPGALIRIDKPVVRVRYEFAEVESPGLEGELDRFLAGLRPGR